MKSAFLKAAIPEPFTILGKRLLPFSLGHELLLQRFDSPFALESKETPILADLFTAVWICSHDFDTAVARFWLQETQDEMAAWGEELGAFDPFAKVKLLSDYIAQSTKEPDFWRGEGSNGKPPGAPWIQTLILANMKLGYSRTEALALPYSLAEWNFAWEAEQVGAVNIWTDRDYALQEAANKAEEAENVWA